MVAITEDLKQKEKSLRASIEKYADLFEVDPNVVRAVISQESLFIANATSRTGAYGYGQFTTIAAKQVQNIAAMNSNAADLKNFTKSEAGDPDRGVKAVCATLWWLYYKKFPTVEDKRVKLEACLTFYNAGGKAAALVVQMGGFAKALPAIKALDPAYRAQADVYAPRVIEWFIAWHDVVSAEKKTAPVPAPVVQTPKNPFDAQAQKDNFRYKALIEALKLLADQDPAVEMTVAVREGLTELTLLFPGEY